MWKHFTYSVQFSPVQLLSHIELLVTPWTAACQASLFITNSWSLLKLMSIESVMPSNHLILYHPLLLPSIFNSIRVFSNESVLRIRWPKYWMFSFSISPSNEYSGLISFRIDWFDLLAFQGTLKSQKIFQNAVLGCSLKNDRMIFVHFQGKPFNITVIQVYAPTTNAKEAEVEQFCDDLQGLLELMPKKDVLSITGDWNAKVGSEEIEQQASLALEYKMKQGKG